MKLTKAIAAITEESLRRSLATIEAALVDRFGGEQAVVETAWLVEWPPSPDHQPRWWHPVIGWTIDANRALRLARKEDAEAVISGGCSGRGLPGVATEHKWIVPAGLSAITKAPTHD